MSTISITENMVFQSLVSAFKTFGLCSATGQPIKIFRGQSNRVPEPENADFAVMWSISRHAMSTPYQAYEDTSIVGSIKNNVLNVTSVSNGIVPVSNFLYAANLPGPIMILSQRDGALGDVGYYCVSDAPDLVSQVFYCGSALISKDTEMVVQVDIHGDNAGDNAQRIVDLFNSLWGYDVFKEQGLGIFPLYTDDPRQSPFIDDSQQFEDRYSIDLHIQINPVARVTQQFADELQITLHEVDTGAEASTGIIQAP